jgi:hypothetical protein
MEVSMVQTRFTDTRFCVGLCLAIASGASAIQPITEQDLQKPSLFAQHVGLLNKERTRTTIVGVLGASALGMYALWSSWQQPRETTPSGSVALYTRLKNLNKLTQQRQTASWGNKILNHLTFTINITIGSLVGLALDRTYHFLPLPHRGIWYRFPSWQEYVGKQWFDTHLATITRAITMGNEDVLQEATALFVEASTTIIIDVRYIITQLLQEQTNLKQNLENSAHLLFKLTNELIHTSSQKPLNAQLLITKIIGLQGCMDSITDLVTKANTRLALFE